MDVTPIAQAVQPAATADAQPAQAAQGGTVEGKAPEGVTADLMEYMRARGVGPGSIDNLDVQARANVLANPGVFGERVLSNMQGFHDRLSGLGQIVPTSPSTSPSPALPGPAAAHPGAPSPETVVSDRFASMMDVFHRVNVSSIETQLVVSGGSRLSNTVNTVMRGQ